MTSALLWVHCLSPLHAGAGTSPGVIDNVIQREVHTGWPMISGATIKGALRHQLEGVLSQDNVLALFGPEAGGASEYAGCASFGDAQIVWFPTRAVKNGFALVTNREVQERLLRLARLAGVDVDDVVAFGPSDPDRAVLAGQTPGEPETETGIESFALGVDYKVTEFSKWLSDSAIAQEENLVRYRIADGLLSVGTEVFDYLTTYSTFVETRVSIDDATGTAKDHLLFSTESVPCETLFCLRLDVKDALNRELTGERAGAGSSGGELEVEEEGEQAPLTKSSDLFDALKACLDNKVFEVGGDISVGRGLVGLRIQTKDRAAPPVEGGEA